MGKLPEIDGWTIDERLKELRKVIWKNGNPKMEFLRFDSEKGDKLLAKYIRKGGVIQLESL